MKKLLSLLLVLTQLIPATSLAAISVPDKADLGAPISHLVNGGGERGAAGWTCSGTDTPTPAVTATTTTPYEGGASLQIDLKSTAGNYCETAFTIPSARVEMWTAKLKYRLASGALADGNIRVDLIDATNSGAVIPLAPGTLPGLSGSLWTPWQGEVQTPYNATSFKLRFTRVAGSGVIGVDALALGPNAKSYGAPILDWKSYTPTIGNVSTSQASARWRQVGDTAEVQFFLVASGNATGPVTISPPPGVTIDSTLSIADAGATPLGMAKFYDSSAGTFRDVTPHYSIGVGANSIRFGTGDGVSADNLGTAFNSGDQLGGFFRVKVTGWSSSTVMSSDAATSVVAAEVQRATATANQSLANGTYTNVVFDTVLKQTHGTYSTSTGGFTAPVTGWYRVSATVVFEGNTTGARILAVGINGGPAKQLDLDNAPPTATIALRGSTELFVSAGQVLSVMAYQNSGGALNLGQYWNFASFSMIQGPQQIAASESVSARYIGNGGQTVASGLSTVLIYTSKDWDSHGIYDTSTGVATVPVSGVYRVKAGHLFASQAWTTVPQGILLQKKPVGGSFATVGYVAYDQTWAASTNYRRVAGDILVRALAGEQLVLLGRNDEATGRTIDGNPTYAFIEITRVGNY